MFSNVLKYRFAFGELVPLHVKSQMITPRETPLAQSTREWTEAGVLAGVTGELVRPGKPPSATFPHALVWLLA